MIGSACRSASTGEGVSNGLERTEPCGLVKWLDANRIGKACR